MCNLLTRSVVMVSNQTNNNHEIPNWVNFTFAGLSGMGATLVVQPLDLIKHRMQLSGEGGVTPDHNSSFGASKSIIKKEGVRGFYAGMSANLYRQATYTTLRLGLYDMSVDLLSKSGYDGLFPQIMAGLLAGFLGAVVATHSDVALVRMTANGKLPHSERRGYKNVFDALARIAREEKMRGLTVGLGPTVIRAMVSNMTQLVGYTQAKSFLITNGYMDDTSACHFTSSLISGLVCAYSTCPLDVAKTRMQNMKDDPKNPLYKGIIDVISKTVQKEGVTALWKGVFPLFARLAPYTIVLFMLNEKLTWLYKEKIIKPSTSKEDNK